VDGVKSWSGLYKKRLEIKAAYPSVWRIPLVKKEMDRLAPNVKDGSKVLEIGAGDRRFGERLKALRKDIVYRSLDVDEDTFQDYRSLDEVKEKFDFVFMFELIEHLTPAEGLELLTTVRGLINPGGKILVGTPNLYHPHRYFGDITHKTPYKYEELGALMLMAGFKDIGFFRVYNDAFLRRAFRLTVGIWLHRFLDIDFAVGVLAEGRV